MICCVLITSRLCSKYFVRPTYFVLCNMSTAWVDSRLCKYFIRQKTSFPLLFYFVLIPLYALHTLYWFLAENANFSKFLCGNMCTCFDIIYALPIINISSISFRTTHLTDGNIHICVSKLGFIENSKRWCRFENYIFQK